MQEALADWRRILKRDHVSGREERGIERIVDFYERELNGFGSNRMKLDDPPKYGAGS